MKSTLDVYKAGAFHIRGYANVINDIVRGHRPRRPPNETAPQLSAEVWKVLQMCWSHISRERPSMQCVYHWLSIQEQIGKLEAAE